jgi:hypothetical protein
MTNINWPIIRAKLKEAVLALPHFFKNPVQGMRMLPEWDWPTMVILQGAFAAACGVLAALIDRNIIGMFTGIIIAPIVNILLVGIGAGFFFYVFMFYFKREIPYRQVYLHVLFAAIPIQIVTVVATRLPPIYLVGAAATLLLLFVAFIDVFQMERKKTRNLLGALMVIYTIFWAVQLVRISSKHQSLRMKATPESLDILEKEMGFGDDDGE